jgi:GT2 family glycosyltransferase
VATATRGFDEAFHIYCEEIDWCWRIHEAGWQIYAVPAAEIVHYGGESTRQIPAQSFINLWRSRWQLYQKHHGKLRFWLAKKLVVLGMRRRARQADRPEMQAAYQAVRQLWQKEGV